MLKSTVRNFIVEEIAHICKVQFDRPPRDVTKGSYEWGVVVIIISVDLVVTLYRS